MKDVKVNDFDWDGFKRGEFRIVSASSQNLIAVLQVLSQKGYIWGVSGISLTEDGPAKDQLLCDAMRGLVYIRAGGVLDNGVIRDLPCANDTLDAVMIDFKEDKNMNMTVINRVKADEFDSAAFKRKEFCIAIPDSQSVPRILQFLHESRFMWGFSRTSLIEDAHMRELLSNAVQCRTVVIESGGCISNGVTYDCNPSSSKTTIELIFKKETNNDKIVITNDGKTTTATLYSNGKKASVSEAVCHDDDKFDIYAGARLALARLEKYKKEAELTDWEKFVKGEVNMRVPKKHIRSFLEMTAKDDLKILVSMADWCLRCLERDGDSVVVFVDHETTKNILLADSLRTIRSRTVDYFPGMK